MSIVKGIIDSHGGEVHMKSTPGKGSKFYFTLPIIKS
ncbi:MAG: ATP-binding protein [Nitrospirota bacterium]